MSSMRKIIGWDVKHIKLIKDQLEQIQHLVDQYEKETEPPFGMILLQYRRQIKGAPYLNAVLLNPEQAEAFRKTGDHLLEKLVEDF